MTDRDLRESIHHALDHRLSGVQGDPGLARRVLSAPGGEKPMRKKMTVSLALALALLLIASVAVAAGLGLFGQLAGAQHAPGEDQRLNSLEQVSENVSAVIDTDDGVQVRIMQAYYEGDRVFISYQMSGNLYAGERYEGMPDREYPWDWTEEDYVISENMGSEVPAVQADLAWLNGEGQRWLETRSVSMHDGLCLADGSYLDIIGGDTEVREDGTVIGWKECTIPQELLADSLSFKAVLFRTHEVWAQDGRSFRRYAERGENTEIPFTLRQNTQFSYLSGATHTGDWQAVADLTLGQIDLKGTVRLICPQTWIDAVASWEETEQPDMIGDWHLYRGDTLLSDTGLQAIRAENDALCFDLLYPRLEDTENLRLVPAYTGSGAHPLEAILLEALVNR